MMIVHRRIWGYQVLCISFKYLNVVFVLRTHLLICDYSGKYRYSAML